MSNLDNVVSGACGTACGSADPKAAPACGSADPAPACGSADPAPACGSADPARTCAKGAAGVQPPRPRPAARRLRQAISPAHPHTL